jgi:hypothetical protein
MANYERFRALMSQPGDYLHCASIERVVLSSQPNWESPISYLSSSSF